MHTNNGLFFLVYFLFSSLLRPLGADAEETGVGASHAQAGESLEFLLLLCDHAGLLLLLDLKHEFSRHKLDLKNALRHVCRASRLTLLYILLWLSCYFIRIMHSCYTALNVTNMLGQI